MNRIIPSIKDGIARNIAHPNGGIYGAIVSWMFFKGNWPLAHNVVDHTDILPHHTVLEIGFGLGFGIQHALGKLEGGPGVIHGVDLSEHMLQKAPKLFSDEIKSNKAQLCVGDVACLPYEDRMFDRVFHSNTFCFWPDMDQAAKELHRVMKPSSLLVTGMAPNRAKKTGDMGLLKYANLDKERYMDALKNNGFVDVDVKEISCKEVGMILIISAQAGIN